jgi:hypothetical protein
MRKWHRWAKSEPGAGRLAGRGARLASGRLLAHGRWGSRGFDGESAGSVDKLAQGDDDARETGARALVRRVPRPVEPVRVKGGVGRARSPGGGQVSAQLRAGALPGSGSCPWHRGTARSPCRRPEIVTPAKEIAGEQQSLPLRLGAPCTTLPGDTQ